jgi:glyceraldehyde-3-phosphate dehydrogenase/erythrose-4-phosphate dehydrogenase
MARMVDTVRTWRTTQVVDGTLVKVMAWYDNEWGFTHQMVREAQSTLGDRDQAIEISQAAVLVDLIRG